MEEKIGLYLLDNSNNVIKEIYFRRPKSFSELKNNINLNFKEITKNYIIFHLSENNNEIIINNDNENKLSKNILFIREIQSDNIDKSIFQINYDKLSESKQEILDEQYNCFICNEQVKKEKPLFCYICQKIFHKKCLELWSKKRQSQKEKLICPNCRNELPLENWKYQLNYEENRLNEAEKMNKINQYKLNNNLLNNINKIKDKKIDELEKEKKQVEEKYNINIDNISNEINEINSLLNINKLKVNNSSYDKATEIIENLKIIKNYIKYKYPVENDDKDEKSNLLKEEDFQYRNTINLTYFTQKEGEENIFGYNFVHNNKDNIELIINGDKTNLVDTYKLKKGENNVTLIIKNKLTDLSYMFFNCFRLKNMNELRYLNTENVKDFSYIFAKDNGAIIEFEGKDRFHSFKDINCLSTWDVFNGENFDSTFRDCKELSDIKALKYWDVSNGINFINMFCGCSSLADLSPLKNWKVSNGKNFVWMFLWCYSLEDLSPLKNWDVSNSEDLNYMFCYCEKLTNIGPLENWNVSKCNNFKGMFKGCYKLENIEPLRKWKVLNSANFDKMFYGCRLSNLNLLKNWNIPKKIIENMN